MPLADRLIRLAMVVTVVVVAAASFTISYSHIYGLVMRLGGDSRQIAILVPVAIDGVLISSSLTLLFCARYALDKPFLARWGQVFGIASTLGANVSHGLVYSGVPAAIMGGWPAVSLVVASELLWWVVSVSRSLDSREVVVFEKPKDNNELDAVLTILANDRSVSGKELARQTGIPYARTLDLAKQARRLLNGAS